MMPEAGPSALGFEGLQGFPRCGVICIHIYIYVYVYTYVWVIWQ